MEVKEFFDLSTFRHPPKETTPQRTFSLGVTETEMSELDIALTHMIELTPQWYTNTQKEKVTRMRDAIRSILR